MDVKKLSAAQDQAIDRLLALSTAKLVISNDPAVSKANTEEAKAQATACAILLNTVPQFAYQVPWDGERPPEEEEVDVPEPIH